MELFFGRHSLAQMEARGISQAMAREAVENAAREVPESPRKTAYYATVEGRSIIVVVAYDVDPPFVVTVMNDWSTR